MILFDLVMIADDVWKPHKKYGIPQSFSAKTLDAFGYEAYLMSAFFPPSSLLMC